MVNIRTNEVLPKLEQILQFRLRDENLGLKPQIEIVSGIPAATDGNLRIFLPEDVNFFNDSKDNELLLADNVCHETDHICEYRGYFSREGSQFLESEEGLVSVFNQKHYSGLIENPALAAWLDNVVKDRRINQRRTEEMQGLQSFYEKKIVPVALYQRPSTNNLSELDTLRELLLQKTLLGKTVESVPHKRKALFEELVQLVNSSENIKDDPAVVHAIYSKLKENMDITQKIKRLPPMPGRNDPSKSKGSPQQGYQGQVQLREGRKKEEKKPDFMEEKGNMGENKDKKDPVGNEGEETDNGRNDINLKLDGEIKNAKTLEAKFQKLSEKYSIPINSFQVKRSDNDSLERKLKLEHYSEIEKMKINFRRLISSNSQEIYSEQGIEMDLEEFIQAGLEAKVTRVRPNRKYFVNQNVSVNKVAWGIISDISPSTDESHYNIINEIRANMLIQSEALAVTNFPFGIYAFSGELYVLKDFDENYSEDIARKIVHVNRNSTDNGTNIGDSLLVVKNRLLEQSAKKKGIILITDGQATQGKHPNEVLYECYQERVFPFLIVIGSQFSDYAKALTSRIGPEHYSVIEKDGIHKLPSEMLRLFKKYGISK